MRQSDIAMSSDDTFSTPFQNFLRYLCKNHGQLFQKQAQPDPCSPCWGIEQDLFCTRIQSWDVCHDSNSTFSRIKRPNLRSTLPESATESILVRFSLH